jgi:sigma-B regulation protein RsbU (phosphoserine phosphatase)
VFDKVRRSQRTEILNGAEVRPHLLGPLARTGLRSLLVVPLHWKRRTLGLLLLMDKVHSSEPEFDSEDSHLADSIASWFAALLHSRRLADYRIAMRKETKIAKQLHSLLMPRQVPDMAGIEIGRVIRSGSHSRIGGDFLHWHKTGDGSRLRVMILDVCGHGIASALMTVLARAIIKSEERSLAGPGEILKRMNDELYPEFSQAELFLTGHLLDVEASSGRFRYANAAHPPPLLVSANALPGSYQRLEAYGMPVGIQLNGTFNEKKGRLRPGDVLLVYTDGVTEARSVQKDEFGEERLAQVVHEMRSETAQQIATAIEARVKTYRNPDPDAPEDDRALVVIKKV